MVTDLFMIILGFAWIAIDIHTGDAGQAFVWFCVVTYAALQLSEKLLKDSKYDY